jgi:hypothetical protein
MLSMRYGQKNKYRSPDRKGVVLLVTDKTGKMLSLFLASAMLITTGAGCSNRSSCVDQNQDGYCDNGSGSSGGSSSYYRGRGGTIGGNDGSTPRSSGGITSGSAAKGGIGSSGSSSS